MLAAPDWAKERRSRTGLSSAGSGSVQAPAGMPCGSAELPRRRPCRETGRQAVWVVSLVWLVWVVSLVWVVWLVWVVRVVSPVWAVWAVWAVWVVSEVRRSARCPRRAEPSRVP
jgi:hypothetical protein